MYGHGGHLGHVTWFIYKYIIRMLPIKFDNGKRVREMGPEKFRISSSTLNYKTSGSMPTRLLKAN